LPLGGKIIGRVEKEEIVGSFLYKEMKQFLKIFNIFDVPVSDDCPGMETGQLSNLQPVAKKQIVLQMDMVNKIITQFPVKELLAESESLSFVQERYLNKKLIKALLHKTSIQFVVADIGGKLNWVAKEKCYAFWKSEVQEHLADNSDKIFLENFPSNYAYIARDCK
jgi:hypothetical protein